MHRDDLLALEHASDALRGGAPADLPALQALAIEAWSGRGSRPVWQPGSVDAARLALSEQPVADAELAEVLRSALLEVGLNTTAPRHFGWVPGGGVGAAAVGDLLAAVTNVYAGYRVPSPGAVEIEGVLLDWLRRLVGLPSSAAGDLCAGGSPATAIALHAATPRVDRALAGGGLAMQASDLDAVVYLSEERHRCVDKALGFIGHGGRVRTVAVDARGRMDPQQLAALLAEDAADPARGRPWLVVASAGTTGTGAVDPLPEIADLCERFGLWFHVDAAYGGPFCLTEAGRARLTGIERADSVVLDPHKGLFQPYGLGAVLVRDGRRLYAAHSARHAYIREEGHHDAGLEQLMADGSAMSRSPELSRPFRALRLWLSVQAHGVGAFRAALDHKLGLAALAWARLHALPGVEVGPPPDLSIVAFRVEGDDAEQDRVVLALRRDHRVFVTATAFRGQTWLRLAILNLHTRLEDVEAALDAIAAEAATGGISSRPRRPGPPLRGGG